MERDQGARVLSNRSPRRRSNQEELQILYSMEVIDSVARRDGTRYVRPFTYETREEAWLRYTEAIRFGFQAYVEVVGRMRTERDRLGMDTTTA